MYKMKGWEQFKMEKLFIRAAGVFILVTAVAAAAFLQNYINDHPAKICVESKSCAINYMNNLNKDDENQ
jgi:hypothetical protein